MAGFWHNGSHFVLITGGASGIGFGLAKRLVAKGHTVAVCGRRAEQLALAQDQCPGLVTIQGDVASESGRKSLAEKIRLDFPNINVLVNNAGIQNRLPPLTDPVHGNELWDRHKQEIAINFEAPMHLTYLLLPLLLAKPKSQVINVTSGLSFVPIAAMATYCATKAAMHSFTLSLRYQLSSTSVIIYMLGYEFSKVCNTSYNAKLQVSVLEIIPPAVNTDLGGAGLHTFGENLDAFSDHVIAKMEESDDNTGYQQEADI